MEIIFHVVIVSDTIAKNPSIDVSGRKVIEIITSRNYKITGLDIIPNNYRDIIRIIKNSPNQANVLIFIGGTGPSPRDITIDVIESISWRKIEGFGELFRRLSYEVEGIKAILSRTNLYILPTGKIIVVLPGSPKAVELGVKLLLDLVEHLVEEVNRFEEHHKKT